MKLMANRDLFFHCLLFELREIKRKVAENGRRVKINLILKRNKAIDYFYLSQSILSTQKTKVFKIKIKCRLCLVFFFSWKFKDWKHKLSTNKNQYEVWFHLKPMFMGKDEYLDSTIISNGAKWERLWQRAKWRHLFGHNETLSNQLQCNRFDMDTEEK